MCAQIVQPLLWSGVLPLSSLQLVGGKCKVRTDMVFRENKEWQYNVEKAAVAVLQGSPGFGPLYDAWVAAGLTLHSCQVSSDQPRTAPRMAVGS